MKNKDIDYSRHKICNLLYELAAKSDEIESLKAENKALKRHVKDLEDACTETNCTHEENK